jgi:RIO kinase 2
MVSGMDPAIRTDGSFCPGFDIPGEVPAAQVPAGIWLEFDCIAPAFVAQHDVFLMYTGGTVMLKVMPARAMAGSRADFIVCNITTLVNMAVPAERIRSLHKYERTILLALERGMKRYSWVPLEHLQTATKLSESEINYRLSRLIAWGMVRFNPVPYDGYALVFGGYDTLALATLTRRGTISALGTLIGEGKESVVYDALGLGPVAIKFHRVGGRSFATARVNREYMPDKGHCPWLLASKRSAEREYLALTILHPSVSVPLPVGQNRHTVVMSLVCGQNLNRSRLAAPGEVLDEILDNVQKAYRAGIIHADLSEYNILMEDGKCVIIDWPQWMETTHPNAPAILARDIDNILAYFQRKYKVVYDREDAIRCVTG